MKIIDAEKRICECCMEEHIVQRVRTMDSTVFKNIDIDFLAEYYYCDSIGFKKVEFDPSLAGPEDGGGRIRVLRVEPGKAPEVREIERGLESLQHEVDGYIECVYPFEDPVALVVNEEGKLDGLELNRALRDETGGVCDIIAGSFLVVGLTDEDFCSLDDEMIKKYSEMFASPEIFLHIGGRLHVFPAPDADSAG